MDRMILLLLKGAIIVFMTLAIALSVATVVFSNMLLIDLIAAGESFSTETALVYVIVPVMNLCLAGSLLTSIETKKKK